MTLMVTIPPKKSESYCCLRPKQAAWLRDPLRVLLRRT